MSTKRKNKQNNKPRRLRKLKYKNESQRMYGQLIEESKMTICSGPAGSGKTYIATYIALEKLLGGEIDRIVITRPIVEAGEKLGHLPGTFEEKIHPYLLPILDCMEDHLGVKEARDLISNGSIEIAPLAFMRGRTFNHCFVLADEMQNSTQEQIKMLMTRYGNGSIFVIDGDASQSDLKNSSDNGLSWVVDKIAACDDIGKIQFLRKDIVRSPLIAKILNQLD